MWGLAVALLGSWWRQNAKKNWVGHPEFEPRNRKPDKSAPVAPCECRAEQGAPMCGIFRRTRPSSHFTCGGVATRAPAPSTTGEQGGRSTPPPTPDPPAHRQRTMTRRPARPARWRSESRRGTCAARRTQKSREETHAARPTSAHRRADRRHERERGTQTPTRA